MNDAEGIRRAYARADKHFARALAETSNSEDPAFPGWVTSARFNDFAYFVLFWGQFESLIDETAAMIEGESVHDMGFMSRVMLCISPGNPYFQDVDRFYFWRCELAHGRIADFPDLVPPVIFDRLEEIAEALDQGALGGGFADLF